MNEGTGGKAALPRDSVVAGVFTSIKVVMPQFRSTLLQVKALRS